MTGAYSFVCGYSNTGALCHRLNELNSWGWELGDSHWYGDYVACKPFAGVRIRIVDFPTRVGDVYRYEADIRFRPDCATPRETVDQAFRAVLAQIPAHTVEEIEWFD